MSRPIWPRTAATARPTRSDTVVTPEMPTRSHVATWLTLLENPKVVDARPQAAPAAVSIGPLREVPAGRTPAEKPKAGGAERQTPQSSRGHATPVLLLLLLSVMANGFLLAIVVAGHRTRQPVAAPTAVATQTAVT